MSELNEKLLEIKRQKDTYILPENLKKNVTAFGVTGTYEGSGGSGDVKLFDTIEHMQEDETAQEGDLAVVYREELQPVTEESEFDSCIFPNTVVLDSAFSDSIYGRFRAVDSSSSYFDGTVDMSSSSFRFDSFGGGMVRVTYTSNDGITYTRTDGGEELVEFGTTIKYESWGDPFPDVIGNFMKISGNYFDGLYEYREDIENIVNLGYKVSDLYPSIVQNTLYHTINDLNQFNKLNELQDFNQSIFIRLSSSSVVYGKTVYNTVEAYASPTTDTGHSRFNGALGIVKENDNTYLSAFRFDSAANIEIWHILNGQFETTTIQASQFSSISNGSTTVYYYKILQIDPDEWVNNYPNSLFCRGLSGCAAPLHIIISGQSATFYVRDYTVKPLYEPYLYYWNIKSQLNATSDYVYGKTFYGKNGVEDGTMTTNVSNSFADVNAEVYTKIQAQYENMQPRVLTDQDKTIDTNIYFIPSKSDGTPLLDTSNVTNMTSMFNNCGELKTIPLLDTSNVTNMTSMFAYCSLLTTIPLFDTSNVTNMSDMFNNCGELKTIPLLDTSNVTNMFNMFTYCSLLTTIPLLDTSSATNMLNMFAYCPLLTTIPLLDTSNVTNMTSMFFDCRELKTIPQLDTSSVTNMYSMFTNCISLSNESLNNILAMCTNSVVTSNKTLKEVGLTQEQVTICQGLSNYSAFISAGWTTGY